MTPGSAAQFKINELALPGKMRLGGTSFCNKAIAAHPLSSGVIAIFAELSTPPRSSTIIIAESK
ncbi:MAG: hypothetical protein P4M05_27125 [Bradyrhizobium sp.]|nr:hypothetical protein [Bradyrhizobium sp.]